VKVVTGPSKLFNKVVSVRGKPGPWFVLTYIPDLQWCHVGPLRQNGVFGNDKKGEATEVTGQPRWMLASEGTAEELDVSAFNCTVLKSKTVRKVQDADREEWCLVDDVPNWDDEVVAEAGGGSCRATPSKLSPSTPPRASRSGGLRVDEAAEMDGAAAAKMEDTAAVPKVEDAAAAAEPDPMSWFVPVGRGDSDVSLGVFHVGDFVTGKWSGKGGWYVARRSSALPFLPPSF
jgi:hypothetical protein